MSTTRVIRFARRMAVGEGDPLDDGVSGASIYALSSLKSMGDKWSGESKEAAVLAVLALLSAKSFDFSGV